MKVERSDQDNHNLFITYLGFGGGSVVKNPTSNSGDKILIPGSGRFLEKEMATHSCILACEIPCTEEPGGLQYMWLQRIRHN